MRLAQAGASDGVRAVAYVRLVLIPAPDGVDLVGSVPLKQTPPDRTVRRIGTHRPYPRTDRIPAPTASPHRHPAQAAVVVVAMRMVNRAPPCGASSTLRSAW